MARQIVVCMAVIAMAGVLGASVYNSAVDARSWGANVPQSISTAQDYFRVVNPADFFRVAAPIAQALALLALIACWRTPDARPFAAAALVAGIASDVLTFAYFYPRNAILMGQIENVDAVSQAWSEWSRMNRVRNAVMLTAVIAELMALMRLSRQPSAAG
jgi:hypothetical protein